jgi:hypothetical protein
VKVKVQSGFVGRWWRDTLTHGSIEPRAGNFGVFSRRLRAEEFARVWNDKGRRQGAEWMCGRWRWRWRHDAIESRAQEIFTVSKRRRGREAARVGALSGHASRYRAATAHKSNSAL